MSENSLNVNLIREVLTILKREIGIVKTIRVTQLMGYCQGDSVEEL
ncbi:hypothetical protein [[Eubacterium] cellulosolvens]